MGVLTRQVQSGEKKGKSLLFLITDMMGCCFDLFVQIIQSLPHSSRKQIINAGEP